MLSLPVEVCIWPESLKSIARRSRVSSQWELIPGITRKVLRIMQQILAQFSCRVARLVPIHAGQSALEEPSQKPHTSGPLDHSSTMSDS